MLLKLTIIFFAAIALVKGQQKPFTKFQDTIAAPNKVIFKARMIGSETENFVYAVCDDTGPYLQFQQRHCNVTIQKEMKKRTCPVHIMSNNPEETYLSQLAFYPLGDDKVIIKWMNYVSNSSNPAVMKILDIFTCQSVDVPLPTNQIVYLAVYKNAVDIGFSNETYCSSGDCKVTINAEGKQISGPTSILKDVDVYYKEPMGPVNLNAPDEGFYMMVGLKNDSEFGQEKDTIHYYKINGQGESVKFLTYEGSNYALPSTSNGFFSFCHVVGQENTIACLQYDKSLKLTLNTTIELKEGNSKRWVQPYNLKSGGLVLVTGWASDVFGKRYDQFSMMKIHQDGQREEAIQFSNLNFTCPWVRSMYVKVLEDETGEICAHFACTHDEELNVYTLQLAIKCSVKA